MSRAINNYPRCYDRFESPFGTLYLIFSGRLLYEISFRKPEDMPFRKGSASGSFVGELQKYFSGSIINFRQKTTFLTGTEFEKKVWIALEKIPFGETRSYKWIAEQAGNPRAVRAAGGALSKNPIPIIIPCHRVIAADGSIGGYALGVDMKRQLLKMEYSSKTKTGMTGLSSL